MPRKEYAPVVEKFMQRNVAKLTAELHSKLHVDTVALHLLRIAADTGKLVTDICEAADEEIDATLASTCL